MVPWNIRPFVIAAVLLRAADDTANAFFVPTALINNARSHVLRSTPDQWLGSSPSDHYGGAVGPMFERFDGGGEAEGEEDTKSYTANIAPLDWNGGTMEAGFSQQVHHQQVHVQSGKSFYPDKPKQEEGSEQTVTTTPEEEEKINKSINWDDGSIRQVISEQQKWIPSGHYDQAFESQSVPKKRDYSTLKQVTPPGKPKMIGYEKPSEKATASEPVGDGAPEEEQDAAASLNWDDGSTQKVILEQQKWIPSGHYETAYESKPVAKDRDYSTLKQVTPAGQPKMIRPEGTTAKKKVEAKRPEPEVPEVKDEDHTQELQATLSPYELWTEKNGEQRKPPAEGFPISEFRSIPDQPGEWFYHDVSSEQPRTSWQGVRPEQKKKSESFQDNGSMERGLGHDEKYEKETRRKREQKLIQESADTPLLQATPPGQPKLIRPDGPPPAAAMKKNGKEKANKKKTKIAASVGTMLDQEQEKAMRSSKTGEEQRLPPAEGFPISGFRSTPDQPWFYHDVSTGSRPDWPNLRQQQTQKQKVYSFQDGGSMESGLGHEPKEAP